MKGGFARGALVVLSLLLCGLAGEVVLRLVGPAPATDRRGLHEPRPDRPWLYGMRPGAEGKLEFSEEILYRVNASGFRDQDYARPKPDGSFRIAVLGDSVAFGYGVEMRETFPKVLERELERLAPEGQRIEVMNFGVSGYNPYTQAALLEDVVASYQPDLVLVQFCINDLNDPTLHFDVQTRLHLGAIPDAAYPDPAARRAPPTPPGALLRACHRSRLCSRLDALLLGAAASEPDEAENQAAAVPVEGIDAPEWRWLEGHYGSMREASRSMGARFAVLAFPYPAQLEGDAPHPVRSHLVAMGNEGGWLTIDPLDRFRDAAARKVDLFLDWWHPTPAGQRLAAREVLRQLACAGYLPIAPPAGSTCDPS